MAPSLQNHHSGNIYLARNTFRRYTLLNSIEPSFLWVFRVTRLKSYLIRFEMKLMHHNTAGAFDCRSVYD